MGGKESACAAASGTQMERGQVVGLLGSGGRWEKGCQSPGTQMESEGGEWG